MPTISIGFFDTWQKGYNGASVTVLKAGTTTKADIFTDEALTVAASNPQTLESLTIGDDQYGKFASPLYTADNFELDIDSTDQTGIIRPGLTTLAGQDASLATVRITGGAQDLTLADMLARVIHVGDYGEFLPTSDPGASSATNTATLTSAIGAASAAGGGKVVIPAETYAITQITIPTNVIVSGQGHDATILQSSTADKVVTLSGDKSGLHDIQLDGVSLLAGSVGIYGKSINYSDFKGLKVRRFETGLYFQGARHASWYDLYISNCATGAKFHGDSDAGGGADGDNFQHNDWIGGLVDLCTTIGVELSYIDLPCAHNTIRDVGFDTNTGPAININGARYSTFERCWWDTNTTALEVDDDSDTSVTDNTVVGLKVRGGLISGGAVNFTGTCQDVTLEDMSLEDVDFTMTSVGNNIVARDCIEDSLVTIGGDGTKWTRCRNTRDDPPGTSGVTTDATPTKAWSVELEPGQVGHIRAVVTANQRDGEGYAVYHIARPVRRPGSQLAYDAQVANFTVGETLTGVTSGATARIVADADGGTTGTLTLRDIVGIFENNEQITDGSGGDALVNGTITPQNAALLGTTAAITAAVESAAGLDAVFAIASGEVEIQVTGEASKTYEWIVHGEFVGD